MKVIKRLLLLIILLALNPRIALAIDDVKLIPSGNVVSMSIKLEYPFVQCKLSKDVNKLDAKDLVLYVQHKDFKTSNLKEINELMKLENAKINVVILREQNFEKISMTTNELRQYSFSDSILGIGTITAVDEEGKYIALSHGIDIGKNKITVKHGLVSEIGYVQEIKSEKGKVGRLVSNDIKSVIGTIDSISVFGAKGKLTNYKPEKDKALKIGKAKLGKAYIYCETPISNEYKLHEIEVTKLGETHADLRIKDKALLECRGGGVQGMSGSPIIQNNKIIGGLSHVYSANTNKCRMLYIEKMLNDR